MIQLYEPETKLLAVNSDGVVAPPNMSYEQFLDWADEDTLAEWVDGVVEMTSPASLIHQNIAVFFVNPLYLYPMFRYLTWVW